MRRVRLDVDTVPAADAARWWRRLDEIDRLVSAAKLLLARRVDDSDAAQRAGLPGTADWLAQTAGTSRRSGQELLAASKRVADLPEVDIALRNGGVSATQVGPIAHAAEADPQTQGELVEAAGVCSLRELLERCAQIRARSDPDPERSAQRIRRARRLRLGRDTEGALCLFGRGPVEEGAELDTVLGVITDEIFHEAHAQGRHEPHEAYRWDALIEAVRRAWAHMHQTPTTPDTTHPAHPSPTDNPDTTDPSPTGCYDSAAGPATRDPADASASGGPDRAMANSDGDGDGDGDGDDTSQHPDNGTSPADTTPSGTGPTSQPRPAPAPNPVQFPQPAPDTAPAPPPDPVQFPQPTTQPEGGPVGVPRPRGRRPGVNPWSRAVLRIDWEALIRGHVEDDETCHIAGVGPVPVSVARRLLDESTLHMVITKGGAVRNVTYLGRGPNAAQRIALLWEQPACSRLGCPRPARQIDHRDDYHRNRHTCLDNLDPLCDWDHGLKSHEGWALVAGTGKRRMVPPGHPDHPGNPTYHAKPQPPPTTSDSDPPPTGLHNPTGQHDPPATGHHDPPDDLPATSDGCSGPPGHHDQPQQPRASAA